MQEFKGQWLLTFRDYVRQRHAEATLQRISARVGLTAREALTAPSAHVFYPEALLRECFEAFSAVVAPGNERLLVRELTATTTHGVNRFVRAIAGLTSPAFLLRQLPTIDKLFRRGPGHVSVEQSPGRSRIAYRGLGHLEHRIWQLVVEGNLRGLIGVAHKGPFQVRLLEGTPQHLVYEVAYEHVADRAAPRW